MLVANSASVDVVLYKVVAFFIAFDVVVVIDLYVCSCG